MEVYPVPNVSMCSIEKTYSYDKKLWSCRQLKYKVRLIRKTTENCKKNHFNSFCQIYLELKDINFLEQQGGLYEPYWSDHLFSCFYHKERIFGNLSSVRLNL